MVDMKEIINSLKKCIRLYYVRFCLSIIVFLLICICVVSWTFTGEIILLEVNNLIINVRHVFVALIIFLECIWFYAHHYIAKKTTRNPDKGKPYTIKLSVHEIDEVLCVLRKHLNFTKINDECLYVFRESNAKRDWRVFLFIFDRNNCCDGIDAASQFVKTVNEATGFKYRVQYKGSIAYSLRAQIFIYDKIPATMIEATQNSVKTDITAGDILVNFMIDLKEGVLYIPRLCEGVSLDYLLKPYTYAIERIGEYLELI